MLGREGNAAAAEVDGDAGAESGNRAVVQKAVL
jgi:hypothetical protein